MFSFPKYTSYSCHLKGSHLTQLYKEPSSFKFNWKKKEKVKIEDKRKEKKKKTKEQKRLSQ